MMRTTAAVLVLVLQLVACGGGGTSGSSSSTSSAPSDLSYPTPPAFAVGAAITPLTPTVTGTVTGYTISPALPAGLTLNATTGVISGTPSAAAAPTNYTVTASNSAGSTTDTLSLEVNAVTPAFTYPSLVATFQVGSAANFAPTSTGGAVATWAVSPALPAGLSIDATTGTISGTPSTATLAANYVVTAQNSGGDYKLGLTIEVASGVLLDLGHATQVTGLLLNGTAALSEDAPISVDQESISRCNLWNSSSDSLVTSLACHGQIALAGPTAVVASNTGFGGGLKVLSSSSGAVQTTIRTPYSWWQLAQDGSYIVLGSSSGVSAYSPTGATLFSNGGDYSKALSSAAAGRVLIALGPKGDDVIETVTVPGGASSTGPTFEGTFNEWFADGSHFQSVTGTAVRTYSAVSVQQDLTSLTSVAGLNGTGNYFWTNTTLGVFNLYAVGSSSAALISLNLGFGTLAIAGGTTVAVLPQGQAQAIVIDLSGASPVQHTYNLPTSMVSPSAYAATSASEWFVGAPSGALLDGTTIASTPKYLALGAALSISGGNSLVAIATGSGKIVVINAATHVVQTTIDFESANVQMSSDGSVLAASGVTNFTAQQPDETLNVYSIPSGTLINSFPYTFGSGTQLTGYTLAPTGTLIAQATSNVSGTTFARQVTAVTGGAVLWSDAPSEQLPSVQFSPDGTIIAATEGPQAPGTNTNFYGPPHYTLSTAVSGWGVGWVGATDFLANIYLASAQNFPLGAYASAKIYSSSGTALSSPPLPELVNVEALTSTTVYSPTRNSIFDLATGKPTFGSGDLVTGSGIPVGTDSWVTNGYDVFPFGSSVVALQY
jgi:hypothetical protein